MPFHAMPICVMPFCVKPICVMPICVMPFHVMPICVMPFTTQHAFLHDTLTRVFALKPRLDAFPIWNIELACCYSAFVVNYIQRFVGSNLPWSQRFFLIFHRMREPRSGEHESRSGEKEKPLHREPSHPFKIKERACFVFLAAMFIFRARGTCGLLVQGLEPRF